ncbi:CYTH and CHAD domain-containing protein [Microvirga aerophila]|uniref:Inorganic triphosphatase n=1 Tax=Microvirga aerophila TaxID=670291 RepID=A0A512C298_9HYPH|nr:CYTH and CHAD domain-containing protein [Microvirga aerophila]GEO18331.1 inorganic triphosphatase [Microvirga aerophila]
MQAKPRAPQEIELKLEVAPSELEKVLAHPLLREGTDGSMTQTLHSIYFDTPDYALQQAGISLRVRRNGDRRIQTIKAARFPDGVALARNEWEHEVDSDSPDYTLAENTALKPHLEQSDLIQPLFCVTTERTRHNVSFNSSIIEVAADRSNVEGKDQTVPYSELELELKDGTPGDLFRLALALTTATPLRLSFKTKAGRGFEATSSRERPTSVKAPAVVLKRKMKSAEAFHAIGASCLQHLMANEAIVRHAPEADAVHQMRVALRRLRAAITLFKAVVADERRDPIRAELKWMANLLGEARDLDVYITKVLEPARDEHSRDEDYQKLLAEYQERRDRAYEVVQEAIASPRFINGTLEAAAWIQVGDWLVDGSKQARKRRDQLVALLAEEELGRRWKKIIKRGKNLEELDPEERHQVRIEIKKLRYATEFFESLFKGGGAKKRKRAALSILEALQETLGELNDIAVGSHMEASSTADAIHQEQLFRIDGLLAEAKAQYQKLAALEPFWRT